MEDLTAFVTARLDEAEVVAKESADLARQVGWVTDDEIDGWNFGAHPMRDLRDIAAKRAILALHATETRREQRHALAEDIAAGKPLWWYEDEYSCVICGWFDGEAGGCETKRQFGTEFSGHPDYRQEWAP